MLNTFKQKKSLKASVKGASKAVEQIKNLGKASPLAKHQKQLSKKVESFRDAFRGTVLDEKEPTVKFEVAQKKDQEEMLSAVINLAAEQPVIKKIKKQKTTDWQAKDSGEQWQTIKELNSEKKKVEKKKEAPTKKPPLSMQVKTTELLKVLKREEQKEFLPAEQIKHHQRTEKKADKKAKKKGDKKKILIQPKKLSKKMVPAYEAQVKQHLEKISHEIKKERVKKDDVEKPPQKKEFQQKKTAQIEDLSKKEAAVNQAKLKILVEKVAQSKREDGIQQKSVRKEKQRKKEMEDQHPQIVTAEKTKPSVKNKRQAEQQQVTLLVEQIKNLVEVSQAPPVDHMQEQAEIKTPLVGSQQAGVPQTREAPAVDDAPATPGAIPEEISTAVQWIAEEEVEQKLVEILGRQAKLRGIDLS